MELMEEAEKEELSPKQIEQLVKIKKRKDKKYESNLTTALQQILQIENERYNGLNNSEVIAYKVVNTVINSNDIVKDAEVLHRMTGEAKAKLDLNVSGGIESIVKPILGEDKF